MKWKLVTLAAMVLAMAFGYGLAQVELPIVSAQTGTGVDNFINECRIIAEESRALKARITWAENIWNNGMNTQVGTGTDALDEYRSDVPFHATGETVTNFLANAFTVKAAINDTNVTQLAVRIPEVN